MKIIQRDNAIINYRISGNGDTTLLYVHGSFIDQAYWNEQVKYFSRQFTVVTVDLPGHGMSGRKREHWSVKGFAEDIITLIKELDLKNIICIGHSLGGDINLIAATSYPGKLTGFIGIDNFKNAATPLSPEYQQKATSIVENLTKDFANTNEQYARMVLLTPQTSPEITARIIKDYRNAYQPLGVEIMDDVFKLYQTEKELLPVLQFKLYLINVDYMPTNEGPLQQYAVNGYEVMHIKGTCHYPMLESPDELNRLIELTIDKILKK